MSLNVLRVTILPLTLIFLAELLILKINFSQGLQNGLYGGMVTAKIPESLQNLLTMSVLWIFALSIIKTNFAESPLKISQKNFLNFRELNVPFVATTLSTPRKLYPIIKLILKFDLLIKWYPFVPHFTQPYPVYDSELNLNSSMYTDMSPFFSNASWRVIASIICRTPG